LETIFLFLQKKILVKAGKEQWRELLNRHNGYTYVFATG
jgi:hypothetical protein